MGVFYEGHESEQYIVRVVEWKIVSHVMLRDERHQQLQNLVYQTYKGVIAQEDEGEDTRFHKKHYFFVYPIQTC